MSRSSHEYITKLVYAVMRPLASLCLSHSIKIQEFFEIAKRAFLDAAMKELENKSVVVSDSKLSVITGLQRKDIAQLRDDSSPQGEAENLTLRIVGLWSSRRYSNNTGKPRVLGTEGKESDFAKLVNEISADLNHHTILFELKRLGLVSIKANKATLKLPAFIVKGNIDQALPLLSSDVRDLIGAVNANLIEKRKLSNLHAKTEYDNIPDEYISKIRSWLLKAGQKLHKEARDYLGQFDRDTNSKIKEKKGRNRVAIGTFGLVEDVEPLFEAKKEKK